MADRPRLIRYEGVEELRERVWNLLLAFHETVNVKMDRTIGDSFGDLKFTIAQRIQHALYPNQAQVPGAPDEFKTEREAHEWIQENREHGFDYLVIVTADRYA